MASKESYYENIAGYYKQTINSYKDAWNMDRAKAIHYGYWDDSVKNFTESLGRMNEMMAETAGVKKGSKVLDAGCGVGGSSFFLAQKYNCECVGISLSQEQLDFALAYRSELKLEKSTSFQLMDYCQTDFPDASFDLIWGCESICYAYDKKELLKEVYRVLKPGGVFIMADGMVPSFEHNHHPTVRKWLDGWQVNYLETPQHWLDFSKAQGFAAATYTDITSFTKQSSRRLLLFGLLGQLAIFKNTLFGKKKWTALQKNNIYACWHQYWGMRRGLWTYGMVKMVK